MRQIRLRAMEQTHLEQLLKMTADRRRARSQAVLRARRGRKRPSIAQALGGPRTTGHLGHKHSQAQGWAG